MNTKQEFIDKLKGPYKVRQELLEAREHILISMLCEIKAIADGSNGHYDSQVKNACLDIIDAGVIELGNLHGDNA